MEILLILVPLATVMALAFLAAYAWAVRNGQFDDTTTPASRILLEDEPEKSQKEFPNKPAEENRLKYPRPHKELL